MLEITNQIKKEIGIQNKISSTCTLIASSSSTLDKIDDINLYLNKNNFDHFTINFVKGINYKNISKIISANHGYFMIIKITKINCKL